MSVTRLPAPAVLAVVRGIIEAESPDRFIDSPRLLQSWIAKAKQMGLVDNNGRVTADGRALYERLSLAKMPVSSFVLWHVPYHQFVAPGERVRIPALAGRTGTVVGMAGNGSMSMNIGLDPLTPTRDSRTVTLMATQLERLVPLAIRA